MPPRRSFLEPDVTEESSSHVISEQWLTGPQLTEKLGVGPETHDLQFEWKLNRHGVKVYKWTEEHIDRKFTEVKRRRGDGDREVIAHHVHAQHRSRSREQRRSRSR